MHSASLARLGDAARGQAAEQRLVQRRQGGAQVHRLGGGAAQQVQGLLLWGKEGMKHV